MTASGTAAVSSKRTQPAGAAIRERREQLSAAGLARGFDCLVCAVVRHHEEGLPSSSSQGELGNALEKHSPDDG